MWSRTFVKVMLMMIHDIYKQITTVILFSYTLYLLLQGWYRHYHIYRTENGFGSGIFEHMVHDLGNEYQYGTSSVQPNILSAMNSAEGFGQMYVPTIVHASSTESPLTELFRSNVSTGWGHRRSHRKWNNYQVRPVRRVISSPVRHFASPPGTLAKNGGFGRKLPHGPKVFGRDE